MALIHTLLGDIDETQLQRTDGVVDNDNERTVTVEYCLPNCSGAAHRTGIAQGEGCFCPHNIHRSVDMTLKRGVEATSAVQGF